MAAKPIPAGFHSATPYLIVRSAASAIEFYKKVFGATEIMRLPDPSGKIAHAEIRVGDSVIMLADESPERGTAARRRSAGRAGSLPWMGTTERPWPPRRSPAGRNA